MSEKLKRYTLEETYLYEVWARDGEEATKLVEDYIVSEDEDSEVKFLQNMTHVFDSEGNEV
jgi:hypothetical protein